MGKVKRTAQDLAKQAGVARSDLNIFYGVIALMESSLVSSDCYPAEARIIAICKSESQKCLQRMDRAMAKLASMTGEDSPHGR